VRRRPRVAVPAAVNRAPLWLAALRVGALFVGALFVGPLSLAAPSVGALGSGGGYAQDAAAGSAGVEPEAVRVGEGFVISFVVTRTVAGEVRFPALIELPEAIEQRGVVQIRSERDGLEWRADYPVVAWRADTLRVAPHAVGVGSGDASALAIEIPEIVVRSVLPADSADLALRDPKPFLRIRSFPWWILAVAVAAAAALLWWIRRRRVEPPPALASLGPGGRALRDFEALRRTWLGGGLPGDRFYDDYEATLRRYARETRGWSPARGLRGLGERDAPLLAALSRSLRARFARVWGGGHAPIADLDAGAAFVRSEMPVASESEAEEDE